MSRKKAPHDPKLSSILLQLARHFVPEDASDDHFELGVGLIVAIWNIGLLPPDRQGEALMMLRQKFNTFSKPSLDLALHDLLRLRTEVLGHDQRLVVEYWVENTGPNRTLKVVSSRPSKPPR